MKKIILLLFLFLSTFTNAQDPDPDLFNQTWYLYSVTDTDQGETINIEGFQPYGGDPEIPQITPYVFIDEILDFNGLGICNTFNGSLIYNSFEHFFEVVGTNQTSNDCGFYENQYEPYFIGPFTYIGNQFGFITISDDSDGFQTMRYITGPFIDYRYRNTPILSTNDFIKDIVTIYPNPTNGVLNFSSENATLESVLIYSVTGAKVFQPSIHSSLNSIDISSLNSGLYFVEITSTEGREVHKILKK